MPFVPDTPATGRFVPDEPAATKLGPKDVPDQAPPREPYKEPTRMELLRGAPEAWRTILSGGAGQIVGRGAALISGFLPENYGTQEGAARAQATGQKVADSITHQPTSRGAQANVEQLGRALEHVEGLGPIVPAQGVGATKVLSGRAPAPKVAAASRAGYRLTPDDAGAGFIAKTASGLSGEPKLARQVSNKNAALATERLAADIGLPEGQPMSIDALKAVRKEEGQKYAAVRQTGRVTSDEQYAAELERLAEKYKSAAKDFPDLARADVEKVVNGLKRESFDAGAGVDMINQLRESADEALRAGNNGLGKVMRGGADAIEGMIERHLESTGQDANLVSEFRRGRERIAKTFMAEKALVGDEVNPQAYRKALEKGAPLTGPGLEIAQNAKQFERSFQKPTHMNVGSPTWADVIMGAVTGGKSLAKEALLAGARPATRAVLASRPYQSIQNAHIQVPVPVPPPDVAAALGLTPMVAPPQEGNR